MKNQEALAHSRLWDAVSGFLQVFAVLQRKLYRDTSQMELLRELLGLQEEMFILLLSMLEGEFHIEQRMHWGQYKFSCCVLCRQVTLFLEVRNVLKL